MGREKSIGSYTLSNNEALIKAILAADLNQVKQLIEEGVDLTSVDSQGKTPLHHAASTVYRDGDGAEIAELLFEKGAAVDAVDNEGRTPLFDSFLNCETDETEGIKLFLEKRMGNPNAKDNSGMAPIHYAAERDAYEVIEQLSSVGADINLLGPDDKCAYHIAIDNKAYQVIE